MPRAIAFLLLFLSLNAQDKPGALKPGEQNAAESLFRMHEAWGPKASTPNASLSVNESGRSGPVIKFRLIADGVPREGSYSLVQWPVTQKGPSGVLNGVTLNASGMAICAGKPRTCGTPDKPDDPIDVVLRPVPGEPVRLGLVSADGATKVFAKIVPVPLRGADQGCSVEATLLTPRAELVLIEGAGFPADSEITMESKSDAERQGGKGKTDSNGRYATALLPFRKGVEGGTTEVTLKSGKCAPSVNVPWGRHN